MEDKNKGLDLFITSLIKVHKEDIFKKVRDIISRLTPREQKIIEMRFGLMDGIAHTLEEVGQEFGVTRERIRQIETKAIEIFYYNFIHDNKN